MNGPSKTTYITVPLAIEPDGTVRVVRADDAEPGPWGDTYLWDPETERGEKLTRPETLRAMRRVPLR